MTDFDVRRTEGAGAGTGAGESLFVSLCVRTSRFSLSFYFMHYLMIGWPLAAVGAASGRDSHSSVMGASAALAAGVAALALLEAILFSWEKRGGKLSREWGLGALTALLGPRDQSVSRR